MATADPRNRLQPALLDRLTDDARGGEATREALRRSALRYTGWRSKAGAFGRRPSTGEAIAADDEAIAATPAPTPAAIAGPATVPGTTPATRRPRGVEPDIDADRVMTKAQLRQAVLRDLGALFNAVRPLDSAISLDFPQLGDSVLNFGLPPLAGQLASKLDVHALERTLRRTILRFEPRILAETLHVRALEATSVLDTHNVVEFEITGHLWSQPVPLEMLLRTQIDLEAGQVRVVDASAAASARSTS